MTQFGGLAERAAITLSPLEFDVLWEHLDLGPMPLVIKVPSPGRTHQERKHLVEQVWRSLEGQGLGRSVDLHPELVHLLRLLARPEREVDGRVWIGHGVRLFAAAVGEQGALAVLAQDQLTLRRASGTGLSSAALGALPQRPAGPGHSVTLRSADLDAAVKQADGTPKGLEAALRGQGVRQEDATTLVSMFTGLSHTGNFGVAARDRWGKRYRPDRVVAFFDTEEGRYLQQRRVSSGSEPWSTFSPADSRRLVFQVEELLAEAVRLAGGDPR